MTLEVHHVLKALKIDGYTLSEAQKLIALADKIAELEPKQLLLRARDLNESHLGMFIEVGRVEGTINDLDFSTLGGGPYRSLKSAYHSVNRFDGDEIEADSDTLVAHRARTAPVVAVINTKMVRIDRNSLVKLTETRDL